MICAISSEGEIFAALTSRNTDSELICLFTKRVISWLCKNRLGWKQNTVFLYDGAGYHCSQRTRQFLCAQKIQVQILGPYGYQIAPIEMLFAMLKDRDLNPEDKKSGKKVS